ncbi:MAG: hypothetical protein GY774_38280 [Planctomycetes bacterium]|nr:hypothetical protein [Planctomycetota bacterium]
MLYTKITYPLSLIGSIQKELTAFNIIICAVFILVASGCAIHHYDNKTGTEHIWGFGHMKMKITPPSEGLQAVVRGTDVLGLSFGQADQQAYLTAGWHRTQRLDVIAESTAIRYEWPDSDFSNVRIGSNFPFREEMSENSIISNNLNPNSN